MHKLVELCENTSLDVRPVVLRESWSWGWLGLGEWALGLRQWSEVLADTLLHVAQAVKKHSDKNTA